MINYKVSFSATAKAGLLEISDYIGQDNPVKAGNFVKELTTSLRLSLSMFPYSGRVLDDLGVGKWIRLLPYKNYNSYYRVLDSERIVEVLYISNARQDTQSFFTHTYN